MTVYVYIYIYIYIYTYINIHIYIYTHTHRSIVESERECKMLRVQRTKLDRLSAALKSERLAEELTGGAGEHSLSLEMYKLLQLTSKLKAQVRACACVCVCVSVLVCVCVSVCALAYVCGCRGA
jgi:hypothetical protein